MPDPEGDQEDAATVFAYGIAKGLEQVLKQCKEDLTRENIMKQAASLNFRDRHLSSGHQDQDQPDRLRAA
jgi:hypothetical protein